VFPEIPECSVSDSNEFQSIPQQYRNHRNHRYQHQGYQLYRFFNLDYFITLVATIQFDGPIELTN